MNAVLLPLPAGEGWNEGQPRVEEPSARYLVELQPPLVRSFDLLATAPQGVAKLRELILSLAVRGKLVAQDPRDEPANDLLNRIQSKLIQAGIRQKALADIPQEEATPFELPASWQWARFGEVCAYIQRGKGPDYVERSDIPVISQKCVRWHGLDLNPAKFISPNSLAKYDETRFLRKGDVLWNSTGTGTIGRAVVVPDNLPYTKVVADSHVTVVRPLLLNPDFLWRWIQSPFVQAEIEGSASGSTNQIELATSTVVRHLLPIPPLAEQARIVARVEELMKLCDALQERGRLEAEQHARLLSTLFDTLAASENAQALTGNWQRLAQHFDLLLDRPEAVDALEQTTLQLAVRGLLVPQDQDDEPASSAINRTRGARTLVAVRNKKDAQVEAEAARPFDVPTTWEWCALGELALEGPNNGLSPKPSPVATAVRCLTLSATTRGYFRPECYKHVDISNSVARQFFLKHGDLLIQRANSLEYVGVAAIYDQADDLFIYPDLMMRLRLTHEVSLEFVHMFLVCKEGRRYFQSRATGTQGNMPKVNQGVVRAVPIPFPPLSEQHRIVARVNELRALYAQLRERLQQARRTQGLLADTLANTAVNA